MKKIFIITLLLFIGQSAFSEGYDLTIPIPGETIANNKLQRKAMIDVYKYVARYNKYCYDYKIIDSQITKAPNNLKKDGDSYTKGFWQELWTVNTCGNKIQVPIDFKIISKRNTIFDINERHISG